MTGDDATSRVIATLERLATPYIRDVIAVQGEDAFDWDYIHRWAGEHGTRSRLDEIRASIPPIE